MQQREGFTLIEIMLVMVIIGILLAVIVPRAQRANADAKHGNIRQAAVEYAAKCTDYAEMMLNGSSAQSYRTTYNSLCPNNAGARSVNAVDTAWADLHRLFPAQNIPRNPFAGTMYSSQPAVNPANAATPNAALAGPGSLYLGRFDDASGTPDWGNYYFIWANDDNGWYGGTDTDALPSLSRGVFAARIAY